MSVAVLTQRRIEAGPSSPGYNSNETGQSQAASPIIIEASIRETHAKTATVTKHPVEDGMDVSDYVRPGELGLQMEVAFSNNKFETADNRQPDGIFSGTKDTRINAVWERFLELIDGNPKRQLLRVTTGLKVYDNMLITDIGTSQTVNNPDSVVIRVTMVQVRIVRSATTRVPARLIEPGEARNRASPTVDAGEQDAPTVLTCIDCDALCGKCIVDRVEDRNDTFLLGDDESERFYENEGCVEDKVYALEIDYIKDAQGDRLKKSMCENVTQKADIRDKG